MASISPDPMTAYASRLNTKRFATNKELEMYRLIGHGRHEIKVGEEFFRLDREDEHDNLDAHEKALAEMITPYWDADSNSPEMDADCGDEVDHLADQTPIKDQEDRGTCVCFASVACLEAILKRDGNETVLSEQYANWLFMLMEKRNQCDDGLRTTVAASYLSTYGVCLDNVCPYEDSPTVHQHCMPGPALAIQQSATYGIGKFAIIDRIGLLGPSIANTDYLESLICKGHDVVFATNVAWGEPEDDGVLDVILDKFGNPLQSRGGHAMLIVGFNRAAARPYFILKNSWGTSVGHLGYYHLSYDYIRTYGKYGYIVYNALTNMSALPPTGGVV
jgi:hypothetical protein